MAQYRFSSQVVSRGTGRSAVAAAAYRAGATLADERTGQVHDFSRKRGIAHSEIMAPATAPDWMRDRSQLWNAVERVETRINSQLAREVQLSLPHELNDAQRLELVRGFVQSQFVERGMIADVAIHRPDLRSDDRNHHAHVMLTMRELTAQGFHASKATPTARSWNDVELLQTWREQWADHQNRMLEQHGHPARVDHRSFEAQGIDREPQRHLGPSAHGMEQRGVASRIGDENRAAEQANTTRARNHEAAAVINLAVERHRRQAAQVLAERAAALQDAQRLTSLDIERDMQRQRVNLDGRLEAQYGAAQRTLAAEALATQARLEATGWRRVLRTVTGAMQRDREQLSRINATLLNIDARRTEARISMDREHERRQQAEKARQAAQVEALRREHAQQAAKKEKALLAEQRRVEVQQRRAQEELAKGRDQARGPRQYSEAQKQAIARKALEKKMREQDAPARRQEKPQMSKQEFDKARQLADAKLTASKYPTERKFIAQAAPAPSPAGTPPMPARRLQELPKVERGPQASQTIKPLPVREQMNRATQAPAPQAAQPPSPARQDWTTAAQPKPLDIKPLPKRDPLRDRDRDRER